MVLVPGAGFEPTCLAARSFKPRVSRQFHHPGSVEIHSVTIPLPRPIGPQPAPTRGGAAKRHSEVAGILARVRGEHQPAITPSRAAA
jgi:hypothetical protein